MLQFRKTTFLLFAALLFTLFCLQPLIGQAKWIDKKASPIHSIERLDLPGLDNEQLRIEHKLYEEYHAATPHTFAKAISVDVDAQSDGSWESSEEGHLLWRQRITSKGAYSLNFGFTNFHLPQSAVLFLSDAARTFVIGPISQSDNDVHQEWWSPVIPGDDVIIEIQIDPTEVPDLKLDLTKVNHDFSGLGAVISGSCNLDVICGEDDGYDLVERYRDLINGVGMMMVQGTFQCTGSLINNTRKNCIPYVLTAEHCGITAQSASTVVVYWNFQNSICREPNSAASGGVGDGLRTQFNSGSRLIAKYDQSDFALVELDDAVDPSYRPYYLGWDRETEDVDSAFVIHHPSGGEKRISFDYDSLIFNVERNFVQVVDWDVGTTEGGSSGSPLFNSKGNVVGHLSAGDAACGNDLEDDFGMFKKSWDGGGTPETRLKDWLDPDQTGITSIDGRYCTDVAVLDMNHISICSNDNTTGSVILRATTGYEDPGAISVTSASPGLVVDLSAPTIGTNEAVIISVSVTGDFLGSEGIVTLTVENDIGPFAFDIGVSVFLDIPADASPIAPVDQTEDLNFRIDFAWSNTGTSYQLEVSDMVDFSSIVREESIIGASSISLGGFSPNTRYFWRVKAFNTCGEGNYSSVQSFTTGNIACQTFQPSDLPKEINLVVNNVVSLIEVTQAGTVADVNVMNIIGEHTWVGDLTFKLISPSGTTVVLVETPCESEDDFNVSFDDDSDLVNLDCPLTTGRSFRPVEPLSSFIGESAQGIWTLLVEDGVREDGGSFDNWTLELCLNQSNAKSFAVTPSSIDLCDKSPEEILLNLSLQGVWESPDLPTVSTGSGIAIAARVSPDPIGAADQIALSIGDPSSLVGQNNLTISFTDGQDVITSNISVTHRSDVESPVLIGPPDKAEAVDPAPELSWNSGILDEGLHRVLISTDEAMSDIVFEATTTASDLTLVESLEELTTHYWQVMAEGICADSSSAIYSFITDKKVATIDETLSKIKIYPSPVRESLTLDLSHNLRATGVSYQLISTRGAVVSFGFLNNEKTDMDVSHLSPGLYLINLISQKGIYTKKIIVGR